MEAQEQNRYLKPLQSDQRFQMLRELVLSCCNPDLTFKGKDLEIEMLKFGFMREGVELVFNTVDSIPEITEDDNEY